MMARGGNSNYEWTDFGFLILCAYQTSMLSGFRYNNNCSKIESSDSALSFSAWRDVASKRAVILFRTV